jgi:hypothetical protein
VAVSTFRTSLVALAVLASACSGVSDRLDEVQGQADQLADRTQFCFAVTRALTSVDGGSSPSQARAAAEEVLAQVPDELRDDAQLVADRLRQASEENDTSVLDDDFRAAAARLRDDTRELCDPTS